MVFGHSYGNINPTVKIQRLRSLQFVVPLSMFRFFTELVMKTRGHFLRPPMRRSKSSFTTSTSLSSEESCQTREIKVSCFPKKWYQVRSKFFSLSEIKVSYFPKKWYLVRSKFFFLIGDKSILLAQEMIPGEVFRKVSLKSNFNLFNDSRNVLFFVKWIILFNWFFFWLEIKVSCLIKKW